MADTANSSSLLGINGTPQFFLVKSGEKDVKALEKCEKVSLGCCFGVFLSRLTEFF